MKSKGLNTYLGQVHCMPAIKISKKKSSSYSNNKHANGNSTRPEHSYVNNSKTCLAPYSLKNKNNKIEPTDSYSSKYKAENSSKNHTTPIKTELFQPNRTPTNFYIDSLAKLNLDIKQLNLVNLGLTEIPYEILHFSQLEYLNLSQNKITEINVDIISQLTNIRSLILGDIFGGNLIKEIRGETFLYLSKLQTLNISNNKLETIPDEVKYLNSIHTINLENNSIVELNENIKYLENIRCINLKNNLIRNIPKDIINLSCTLELLDLTNNLVEIIPNELLNKSFVILTNNPIKTVLSLNRYLDPNAFDNINILNSKTCLNKDRIFNLDQGMSKSCKGSIYGNIGTFVKKDDSHDDMDTNTLPNKLQENVRTINVMLKELCLRTIINNNIPINIEKIKVPNVLDMLSKYGKPCNNCPNYYVNEYYETLGVRNSFGQEYLTKFSYCSIKCCRKFKKVHDLSISKYRKENKKKFDSLKKVNFINSTVLNKCSLKTNNVRNIINKTGNNHYDGRNINKSIKEMKIDNDSNECNLNRVDLEW